jgi:hypothetical protein
MANAAGDDAEGTVLDCRLSETDLRFGMERRLRALARHADSDAERFALVAASGPASTIPHSRPLVKEAAPRRSLPFRKVDQVCEFATNGCADVRRH